MKHPLLLAWILAAVFAAATTVPSTATATTAAEAFRQGSGLYGAYIADQARRGRIITGQPINERVNRIVNRLIAQAVLVDAGSARWDWQVHLIQDDSTAHLFSMPGGQMGVYSGLLTQLKPTDDELAQALAHEIAHTLEGHGVDKLSIQFASNLSGKVLGLFGSKDRSDQAREQGALASGAALYIERPNSRSAEADADRVGLELAARAGFDPAAAADLWKKFDDLFGVKTPLFTAVHPSAQGRIQELRELGASLAPLLAAARARSDPAFDWLATPVDKRPAVEPSRMVAYRAPRWAAFEAGRVDLRGDGSGWAMVQAVTLRGRLSDLYRQQAWRDLADEVMKLDLRMDLMYHYLGRAALGMGHREAGRAYLARARELGTRPETSCLSKTLWGCGGIVSIGSE